MTCARPASTTPVSGLSGGNQQKVIVAREFSRPIKLLIASQPTRGLDVGSIEYIHSRIIEKRDEGTAVLLVSSELDEILALSDRIAVMYKGQIVAIVPALGVTKEYLGLLMAGVQAVGRRRSKRRRPTPAKSSGSSRDEEVTLEKIQPTVTPTPVKAAATAQGPPSSRDSRRS